MAGPTRAITVELYNELVQQLNVAGNTPPPEDPYNALCFDNFWINLEEVEPLRRLRKDDFEYLKAGALTLDNTLDYDAANGVAWVHDDLYTETIKATAWQQCQEWSQVHFSGGTFPYFCVDCDSTGMDFRGPVEAAYAASTDALGYLAAWEAIIENGGTPTEIAAAEALANSKASIAQSLSKSVYNFRDTRYRNIWNYVPSNAGSATEYKFYQWYDSIEPDEHYRFYIFAPSYNKCHLYYTYYDSCSVAYYVLQYSVGGDESWYQFNNYSFKSAPDGTFIFQGHLPMIKLYAERQYENDEGDCYDPLWCQPDYKAGRGTLIWNNLGMNISPNWIHPPCRS